MFGRGHLDRRGPEDCEAGAGASCFIPEAALHSSGCFNRELLLAFTFNFFVKKFTKLSFPTGTGRGFSFFQVCRENQSDYILCRESSRKEEQTVKKRRKKEKKKKKKQVVELFGGKTCG